MNVHIIKHTVSLIIDRRNNMTGDTTPTQIDILYESISETTLKSKRLNYEKIKE